MIPHKNNKILQYVPYFPYNENTESGLEKRQIIIRNIFIILLTLYLIYNKMNQA